jgi:hypothetical protein
LWTDLILLEHRSVDKLLEVQYRPTGLLEWFRPEPTMDAARRLWP